MCVYGWIVRSSEMVTRPLIPFTVNGVHSFRLNLNLIYENDARYGIVCVANEGKMSVD